MDYDGRQKRINHINQFFRVASSGNIYHEVLSRTKNRGNSEIDESEFKEIEVSELEKAKVKSTLRTSIKQQRKKKSWKKNLAVAAMVIGLSVPMFGLTFPTYAGSIPMIGDIFRFLDNGRTGMYDEYKEYSTELNMTEVSNGIRITINDVIFDGKTVFLTYSLESEQDLGDDPFLYDSFNIKGATGQTCWRRL